MVRAGGIRPELEHPPRGLNCAGYGSALDVLVVLSDVDEGHVSAVDLSSHLFWGKVLDASLGLGNHLGGAPRLSIRHGMISFLTLSPAGAAYASTLSSVRGSQKAGYKDRAEEAGF